ncbi:MAG: type II toxin-antitoxin system HicB family antitoxin [Alkaliphilus sp.]
MNDLTYYLNIKYPLIMTQDEDSSYYVEYPDLKGCISCGSTIDEAFKMAEDAKLNWLESAIENNIEIPTPKDSSSYSGNLKLRMPKSLHKSLAYTAKKEGVSMNQLCVYLLSKELEHHHTLG